MGDTAVSEAEPMKHPGGSRSPDGRRQCCEPIRPATTILPAHWANPEALTAEDPCRAAKDPAACAGDGCHAGIWAMRPGLAAPAAGWVATGA